MRIRRGIINSLLASVLAINLAGLRQDSCARQTMSQSPPAYSVPGGKDISLPTKSPQTTPSICWLPPDGKARVAMLCLHGFSLHKGCYTAFGQEMAKNGIAVYAIDMRGFGESKRASEHTELDFDGCMADIKATLLEIRRKHPGLPVVVLGESMGGAMAIRAAAFYPDLVAGLISAVPARDRFGFSGSEAVIGIKAGVRTIFGGYRKPMKDAALAAVDKISAKEEVRSQWSNDPLMRTSFSPKEFVQLDNFMADNLEAAEMVKVTPVLFIQGTNDKLIRPAGTWKLFERLSTPNRQMVLSKNSEHLIFEEGQFKPDDLAFVATWISRNITLLHVKTASGASTLPVVASAREYTGTNVNSTSDNSSTTTTKVATLAPNIPKAPEPKKFENRIASGNPQINFWIELHRDGKMYRCNNKTQFKSGDSIRFHLIPESDGYAYLVMRRGTTGKSDVLFPNAEYGTQNFLRKGQDYPVPITGWMQFDQNPGTEQLGLVFGQDKLDVTPESLKNRALTCFV
ncbi:MAG: alpha/beta fold hydrolase, partial [Candidatus Obscuribacterales bacterium]|nr:alpha/beta fold hydrolase [Candidatus Obscuribacterales bacterium]